MNREVLKVAFNSRNQLDAREQKEQNATKSSNNKLVQKSITNNLIQRKNNKHLIQLLELQITKEE